MKFGLPAGDHHLTLDVVGVQREYLLHIPRKPSKSPRPVVSLLHGTGGNVRWTQEETRFDQFADRVGFVAIYPQALTPDPDHPPKFLSNPPMWNAGSKLFPSHKPDDLGFMRALLDDVPTQTPVDSTRIYATGFSNGAAMCFRLAAELGEQIAAIAPIAGYCREKRVKRPVPTLYIIGTDDPMIPPFGGEVTSPWTGEIVKRPSAFEGLNHWAHLLGCANKRVEIEERNGVRDEEYPGPVEFRVMTISGLGHHWPGGRGRLKKKLAGEPSNRIDANNVIWEFFLRQQRA